MQKKLILRYLCDLLPPMIQDSVLSDAEFSKEAGRVFQSMLTIHDHFHVVESEFFSAVRHLLTERKILWLNDVDGQDYCLSFKEGAIWIESESFESQAVSNDLFVLSHKKEERVPIFHELIRRLGPTAPDFTALLNEADVRPLSDSEVSELFKEVTNGVAGLQARAYSAFRNDEAYIDNLVPESFEYYERFCGPNPEQAEPEMYLNEILPTYRRNLLRRGMNQGLDICLLGALRSDLLPGAWTQEYNDDDILNAIEACNPWINPFSLLGVLDIAVARQYDQRFYKIAEEAISRLASGELLRTDGIDSFELLPILTQLVLNRINTLEGGLFRPPFWKRMCAYMHAGFLLRLTSDYSLDLETFKEWALNNQSPEGVYVDLLGLRNEPLIFAFEVTPNALRQIIVGRLVEFADRFKSNIPNETAIKEAKSRIEAKDSIFGWTRPGPLEGHYARTSAITRPLIGKNQGIDFEQIEKHLIKPPFSGFAKLVQYYDFDEELMSKIREAAKKEKFDETKDGIGPLADGCIIACAMSDKELATIIASKIIEISPHLKFNDDVVLIFKAILIAAAAFIDENEWAEWLEMRLAEFASRVIAGDSSRTLLAHIRILKKVTNLELGIFSRAEALASAAN